MCLCTYYNKNKGKKQKKTSKLVVWVVHRLDVRLLYLHMPDGYFVTSLFSAILKFYQGGTENSLVIQCSRVFFFLSFMLCQHSCFFVWNGDPCALKSHFIFTILLLYT